VGGVSEPLGLCGAGADVLCRRGRGLD